MKKGRLTNKNGSLTNKKVHLTTENGTLTNGTFNP